MTFDPSLVERHSCVISPDGTIRVKATRGFGELPPLDVPIGCPPEFAAMIRAAANGDTSLIERSYWEHPERRQRPEQETRSAAAHDNDDDDEDDDDNEIERIDGLDLESATREFNEVTVVDLPTAIKSSRLKHRIAHLKGKRSVSHSLPFRKQINMVTMDLVAPAWALEITKKAEERGQQESAIRRRNLLNAILD